MSTMPNAQWVEFLRSVSLTSGGTEAAADPSNMGIQSALTGCFVCDLSQYSIAAISGPDAESFLHAQLSSDVRALGADRAQFAAYNSPKGRVLAIMLMWRYGDGILVHMPRSIAPGVVKRLSMYILRSKVTAMDVSDRYIRFGLGGPAAADTAAAAGIRLPSEDLAVLRSHGNQGTLQPDFVLFWPSGRFELVYSDVRAAIEGWRALCAQGAQHTGASPWQWLSVRSGIAEIGPESQDRFVPQMLNLDLVGAVSFTKGCYPGQEIVARAQYRGELKRRTCLTHLEAEAPPVGGQEVVNATSPQQAIGTLVSVAPAPGGGYDALACLHMELTRGADLRLVDAHGPRLEPLGLPYKLPGL